MRLGFRELALAGVALATISADAAWAQAPARARFDIRAQDLGAALRQFAVQSGLEVLFDPTLVQGKRAAPLQGEFEVSNAMEQLLRGSGLRARASGRTVVIAPALQPVKVAGPATMATTEAPAPRSADVEEIVVVGSKIGGAQLTGSLPVSVVDEAQIKALGAVSTGELIGLLPQSGVQAFNSGVQGPNNARGDVSSANLRGLGSGNTLVLLDGRRMVAHPTTQQEGGTVPVQIVNLNAIPSSALKRVEVLRDGASAIYGSDATAGVLNFVVDRNFEGAQASLRYGGAESANLEETDLSAKWGGSLNGGRTHVAVFGELFHNTDMPGADRDYAATDDLSGRVPAQYASFFNRTVSQAPWINARVATPVTGLGPSFTTFITQPCGFAGSDAQTATPGVCVNGGVSAIPAALRSDEGPLRTLQPRTTRGSLMGVFDHNFENGVTAFGDALYYRASAWAGRGGSTTLTDAPLIVSRNNPYNPFGNGPGRLPGYTGPAQDVTIVGYDILDVGNRSFDVDNTQYRGLFGFHGTLAGWRWETAALYSRAETKDTEHNRVSNTALQRALQSSDPATAYNPFNGGDLANLRVGDATANPAAVVDALRIDVTRRSVTSLAIWSAEVSNAAAFSVAERDIGLAGGVEWRRESYDDDRDPRVNGTINYVTPSGAITSDVVGTSATLDTHGDRNVMSAYAEARSQLVGPADGVPLVDSFEVQLAARYERYSDTDDQVLKPKVAASWGVTPWLKLRGAYSQAFRAPNLEQINAAPATRVQQNQTDLFRCAQAQGVTTIAALNRAACAAFRFDVTEVRSGNDQLKAEDSETYSVGLVLTPVRNLVFTVDFWRIKQDGLVGVFSTQDQINLDAVGRLGGGGPNPLVTRNAAGQVTNVSAVFQNLNARTVESTDFGLSYSVYTDSYGDFRVNADVSVFGKFYQSPSPEAAALVAAGLATASGGSQIGLNGNPRTRASVTGTWSGGAWQVTGSGSYISAIYDTTALNFPVSSWTIFNASTRYAFDDGALAGGSIRVGVNNIADKDPPIANQLFGYYTSLYNARGRFLYVELTKTF